MDIVFNFDMDGVLAKWNKDASEEETHEKGYFLRRILEVVVKRVILLLISMGYKVRLLSAVYQDDHSEQDKREWLQNIGLGHVELVVVPYGKDKYHFVDEEEGFQVLIDDYSKNLNAWEKAGHLAFKFFNGINDQPRISVENDGTLKLVPDTWTGYSVDRKMTAEKIVTILTSVAQTEAAERRQA